MKKTLGSLVAATFLLLVFVPVFTYAVQDPATVGKTGITYQCTNGNCDYNDLISAVKNIVNFMVEITLAFSVVVIAFAGSKYLTSGDNPGKRKEANAMLQKVAIGIVCIMAAWLIVTLITNTLLNNDISQLVPLG